MSKLRFEPEGHSYFLGSRELPSVTKLLGPITSFEGVPPETLARAAERGVLVHEATHLWDSGVLDESSVDERLRGYLHAWKQFLSDTGARVIASECQVYHGPRGYAGTFDKALLLKGRHVLVDIKSAEVLPQTVWPQLAAYLAAYLWMQTQGLLEDWFNTRSTRACVQLRADGQYLYRAALRPYAQDFNVFISSVNVYHYLHG